jgi:D-alanine-D-alanine ligase
MRVAVLFGGKSGEHEVSLTSARAVIKVLQAQPDKYQVVPIGITKQGRWITGGAEIYRLLEQSSGYKPLPEQAADLSPVLPEPASHHLVVASKTGAVVGQSMREVVDVVFPVLHGPNGEDGTVQGLLEVMSLPYVGAGVLGSALGMDKIAMKYVFGATGLPVLDFVSFLRDEWRGDNGRYVHNIEERLGYPCFVKPANMGSSVGISKAHNREELIPAIDLAAKYDRRLLVEKAAIDCREIECAVLGNDDPIASVPGEVVPCNEFYDYQAKYLADGSKIIIPAELPQQTIDSVRRMAVQAFKCLDCAGMSRVDFFVSRDGRTVWNNEVNTIPGFTPISMYPKMWEASGIPFATLVDKLIELALERYKDKNSESPL